MVVGAAMDIFPCFFLLARVSRLTQHRRILHLSGLGGFVQIASNSVATSCGVYSCLKAQGAQWLCAKSVDFGGDVWMRVLRP